MVLLAKKDYMLIAILHFDCFGQLRTSFSLIPNIYYTKHLIFGSKTPPALLYLLLNLESLNSISIQPKASSQSLCTLLLDSAFDLQKIKLVCFIHLLD